MLRKVEIESEDSLICPLANFAVIAPSGNCCNTVFPESSHWSTERKIGGMALGLFIDGGGVEARLDVACESDLVSMVSKSLSDVRRV